MEWQDLITLGAGLIAFGLWFVLRWQRATVLTVVLVLALPVASHFAYPDRYFDAMWLIGALFAFAVQLVAVVFAAAIGWAARLTVMRVTLQSPGQDD